MKENDNAEEILKKMKQSIEKRIENENCIKNAKMKDNPFVAILEKQSRAIEYILSEYKRVLKINEVLLKENEKLKKDYYNVINKIENKIDKFDYKFEKAKRQNNKDKSDCYWNLIINFKELLESEE